MAQIHISHTTKIVLYFWHKYNFIKHSITPPTIILIASYIKCINIILKPNMCKFTIFISSLCVNISKSIYSFFPEKIP